MHHMLTDVIYVLFFIEIFVTWRQEIEENN